MTNTNDILEEALSIALQAHKGQIDKGGHPYILHPIRVMQDVCSVEEKIVAVLHDVIEDTSFTCEDLEKRGIPKRCVQAVQLLTHDKKIPYMEYIKGLSEDELARNVKLADLKDNSDPSRLKGTSMKDLKRLEKYKLAIVFLRQISRREQQLT